MSATLSQSSTTAQGEVRLELEESTDVVRMRQLVREHAIRLGFSLVDQTKIVTAASELARNVLQYGGGGYTGMGPQAGTHDSDRGAQAGAAQVFGVVEYDGPGHARLVEAAQVQEEFGPDRAGDRAV